MIHSIFNTYDNTIYEQYSIRNTGLDAVLDLSKTIAGTTTSNNRVLMKFDLDTIQNFATQTGATNLKYYLNLYTVQAQEVPSTYTIEVYPLAMDWDSGVGKYLHVPQTTMGSSWANSKNGTQQIPWQVGSFYPNETASWSATVGGGTWNYSIVSSQSFDYSSTDIRVDVTDIVNAWIYGLLPNYGFIIKKSNADEKSLTKFETLKYYSGDTATIYLPKLEMAYDDAVYQPGTLQQPDSNKDVVVYVKNLKKNYKQSSKTRFDVGVREKYPTITFATQSNYITIQQLPTSSLHYSIMHADTDEVVIPFDDDYTKVSCGANGNYFNMWMGGLQPERYYKVLFRVSRNGSEDYIDNNQIFKVTR